MTDSDDKYITFKRADFMQWCAGLTVSDTLNEIADAVVIRRQDLFASPALGTYAACISMVGMVTDDKERQKQLMQVADYFQRQSELAAEEGWKLPDV